MRGAARKGGPYRDRKTSMGGEVRWVRSQRIGACQKRAAKWIVGRASGAGRFCGIGWHYLSFRGAGWHHLSLEGRHWLSWEWRQVSPGDSGALADRIAFLLERPELRAEMGRAARARAEQEVDIRGSVRRFEILYTTLLEAARRSSERG